MTKKKPNKYEQKIKLEEDLTFEQAMKRLVTPKKEEPKKDKPEKKK